MHFRAHKEIKLPSSEATVQAALDPAVFAEAFAAGRQMSLAEAFTTILAPGHVGGVHGIMLR